MNFEIGDVVTIQSHYRNAYDNSDRKICPETYLNVEVEKIICNAPHPYQAKYYKTYFSENDVVAIIKRWGVSNSSILAGIDAYIKKLES